MPPRARLATSLLGLAAVAAIAVLLAIGASGPAVAAARPCGSATDRTALRAALAVALQIRSGELSGSAVRAARTTIERDRVLAAAVAGGDLAAIRSEVYALVYNHQHIVRLRILVDGRERYDLGGKLVLSPFTGMLHYHGRVVGSYVASLQDDYGFRLLAERLIAARTVFRYQGQTIMSNVAAASATLPAHGTVTVGAATYLVTTFHIGHFPSGMLAVSLFVPAPSPSLSRRTCAQVRAEVLVAVAHRAYDRALIGSNVLPARNAIAHAAALINALSAGDDATAAAAVHALVAAGGFTRLRVTVASRVIADAGSSEPLIAPQTRPLIDSSGRTVGEATFSVQSAKGFADLAHALTKAQVLVRAGARQLFGTFSGPQTLPRSGAISYNGTRYEVASFAGVQFPSGPLRVYLLVPG